ncbi:MAG TPA: DUF3788 family protein [Bacteroidales bacterium]|jgi:hypothetical protein|nr:DUF3788 family protein [Bacteroidales bacterium]
MEPLVLSDKSKFPTDDLIFSIIGKNSEYWNKLMEGIHEKFPGATGQWNYYNDGKNWLFKMVLKKKTLFWIGILSNTFRITFYFGAKAESLITASDLSDTIKQQYLTGQRFGKIRCITFKVEDPSQIDEAIKITEIKSKC